MHFLNFGILHIISTLIGLSLSLVDIPWEISQFCRHNGHHYISTVNMDMKLLKALSSNVRVRNVLFNDGQMSLQPYETLIFLLQDEDLSAVLDTLSKRKVQRSILILEESNYSQFLSGAERLKKNAYFYVMIYGTSAANWQRVITLSGESKVVVNPVFFNENGVVIEHYDLQGIELVTTSLTWAPYISVENCSSLGRSCLYDGLLVDLMNSWANRHNFTWDIFADLDGDWGQFPVSGPFNLSGEWKGVMGDVIKGRYPLSLNAWTWLLERDPLLDFVPVLKDNQILAMIPKPPKIDPGLFIRPFTEDAWVAVCSLLAISFIALIFPYLAIKGYDGTDGYKITATSIWFFFVLINAYYSGALTMFFASETTLPFNTIRDVLKEFPTWNLIFQKGNDNKFKLPALQGDEDYVKYWTRVEKEPGKYRFNKLDEGFQMLLADSQTVMHTLGGMLRGAYLKSPSSFPAIKTFGATVSTYSALELTKNSPLTPLFRQAVTKSFESGQYERLSLVWQGKQIKSTTTVDTMILSSGQVFLVFGILSVSLIASMLCFLLELMHFRMRGKGHRFMFF